ncbi:MAG TPA: iron ABC transporter permease [Cyclobacteriaceae bacterium]
MNVALAWRDSRNTVIISSLGILLFISVLFSLTVGAVSVPVSDVIIIMLQKVGLFKSASVDSVHEVVLSSIRIPRILMTLLIGGSLGVCGAALQGLFRNPLVEPSLIGVSGGAAAGVVFLIVFGSSTILVQTKGLLYHAVLPMTAFAGGLLTTFLILRLSNYAGKTNIPVLILVGVAINALAGAVIGLAVFYADEDQLRTFTFWTLGDLGGASWETLAIAAPLLVLSTAMLLFFSPSLNALALGEAEAYHMGVDVERTKRLIILCCALGVGVSVSMAGIIGFVGLVVPHLVRVLFHSDNRLVLPASILGGAWLLIIADLIARTIVTPSELPIGVVTALIGSPFFIMLLLKANLKNEI